MLHEGVFNGSNPPNMARSQKPGAVEPHQAGLGRPHAPFGLGDPICKAASKETFSSETVGIFLVKLFHRCNLKPEYFQTSRTLLLSRLFPSFPNSRRLLLHLPGPQALPTSASSYKPSSALTASSWSSGSHMAPCCCLLVLHVPMAGG